MKSIHAAVLATVMLATSTPAFGDVIVNDSGLRDVPYREVHYGDLNLASDQGLATLNRRILIAVREVCDNGDMRQLSVFMQVRACRSESTARAFADRDAVLAERLAAHGDPTKLAALGSAISIGGTRAR